MDKLSQLKVVWYMGLVGMVAFLVVSFWNLPSLLDKLVYTGFIGFCILMLRVAYKVGKEEVRENEEG